MLFTFGFKFKDNFVEKTYFHLLKYSFIYITIRCRKNSAVAVVISNVTSKSNIFGWVLLFGSTYWHAKQKEK